MRAQVQTVPAQRVAGAGPEGGRDGAPASSAALTGGVQGPPVMSRRAYSITASITLLACRRVLAAATSRPPSPISDVKMVA